MSQHVKIFDTTLRDGEQAPGFSMDPGQKLRMAQMLLDLQVDIIEAGFPIASPGDFDAVEAVAKLAADNDRTAICGLARAGEKDVRAAGDAIGPARRRRIHTFIATSPVHREHKLRLSKEEVKSRAIAAVTLASELADEVEFSAEDAIRTERDYLAEIFGAVIEAGATTINVPDTVGYTTPEEMEDLMRFLVAETPGAAQVTFSAHCHDDLGMAVANSLAAVRGGARQVECTINGIGERAGNCALEEIVMTLATRRDLTGLKTQVDTEKLYPASRLLERLTGQPVPRNKAIVGANAFAHESGIHQDGVLKNVQTYEIMSPASVGAPDTSLVLGKHSGRNAIADRAASLGHNLAGERLDDVFRSFKKLADKKKKVTDEDLKSIIIGRTIRTEGPWKVTSVETGASRDGRASARLQLRHEDGRETIQTANGNGPLDAAFTAIRDITGVVAHLEDYTVKAVGGGKDAQGWADVRLRPDAAANGMPVPGGAERGGTRDTVHGSGVHTDVIFASVIAYLDAINRIVRLGAEEKQEDRPDAHH